MDAQPVCIPIRNHAAAQPSRPAGESAAAAMAARLPRITGYGAGSRVVPIPSKNYGAGRKARTCCTYRAELVRAWWPAYRRLPPVFAYRATTIVGSPPLSGWTSKLGAACAIAPRHCLSARPRLRLTASGPPCAKTGELRFLAPAAIAADILRTSCR